MLGVIEVAGKHRSRDGDEAIVVPRGVFDLDERQRATALTAAAGGRVWGLWSRRYFVFGPWGAPFVSAEEWRARAAIGEAYGWPGWVRPGGR